MAAILARSAWLSGTYYFNDDAIVNTLNMIRDMMNHKAPYEDDLIDKALCVRLGKAFNKGIECILATQIIKDGEPSVWCQQNDRETLKPAPARAYELPSYCSAESAGIVRLLMELPAPDARVKRAVHGAMKWFDRYKLTGLKCERIVLANGERDTRLVEDPQAKPIWARYYDLKYCEPYVCDRDGLPRRHLEEIGTERRNGYSWYNSRPAELFAIYNAWADKYDPKHKVAISLATKGANENGLIEMYRRPMAERTAFDVVVKPGESIQAAIEKAPEIPTEPFKILLLNGTYHQKVIIDRPNIVLVGENRDSTRIVLAETAQTRAITEYHGRPVGNGVIVLQEGADDCVISGLTVYNNYGTAVEIRPSIRWRFLDVPLVPSSSTVMCGPMETMPFPCGRPEAMVCIIMPISIFVVRVWIFFVLADGAMPHAAILW